MPYNSETLGHFAKKKKKKKKKKKRKRKNKQTNKQSKQSVLYQECSVLIPISSNIKNVLYLSSYLVSSNIKNVLYLSSYLVSSNIKCVLYLCSYLVPVRLSLLRESSIWSHVSY